MRRRILLTICVVVTLLVTVVFTLWYSGFFEQDACLDHGGKWVKQTGKCVFE